MIDDLKQSYAEDVFSKMNAGILLKENNHLINSVRLFYNDAMFMKEN